MTMSVGDQERAERALKRNIYKRDQAMDQLTVLMGLVNTVQEPGPKRLGRYSKLEKKTSKS